MAQPKNFGFTEEAKQLKDSARRFFQNKLPADELHNLVASEYDPHRNPVGPWNRDLWRQMVELGWSAVAVPEEAGGIGFPVAAVTGLVEEMGRAALPSPLLATINSSVVLSACSSDQSVAALGLIADGQAAALAVTNQVGSWELTDSDVRAEQSGGAGNATVLSGLACYVQDASKADFFVVSAKGEQGMGLYKVSANAEGLTITPDAIVDLTRDQAHLKFEAVVVAASDILAEAGSAASAFEKAEPTLITLVAADMVGAGEWLLQTTVEYAKTRVQFDHPLGFFQAVKHPLVDLMVMIDHARGLVYNAACAADLDPQLAPQYASMAKASASEMAAYSAIKSVQLHGGIGFTWECFVHLYTKRQKHNEMLMGDAAYHRLRLADQLFGKLVYDTLTP